MKKYGYHRLVMKGHEIIEGPLVVVLADDKTLVSWHHLDGEEPMVEWLGGTLFLD